MSIPSEPSTAYHISQHFSVPEYKRDIRFTSFGGIPRRARILQSTFRFTERLAETLGEDKECQDAIYGRLLVCETKLVMALVS